MHLGAVKKVASVLHSDSFFQECDVRSDISYTQNVSFAQVINEALACFSGVI